jgi:hypothetical protein
VCVRERERQGERPSETKRDRERRERKTERERKRKNDIGNTEMLGKAKRVKKQESLRNKDKGN